MSSEPKVSIVIPVYNTAPYLRQCLDSVVNQTLRDIEIICVDDGSTDGSLAILEEYAAIDQRVRILRQQNQYAGVARNNGMAVAMGKYLMFWDSDDYFDLTALEKMYDQCEADQADICVCGGKRYYEATGHEVETNAYLMPKRVPERLPFNRFTNQDYLFNFTTVMIWNKLYRRAFIEDEGLQFQAVRNGNDVYFSAAALCLADRITVVLEHLVTYRIGRDGSLVSTLSAKSYGPLLAWVDVRRDYGSIAGFPDRSFANKVVGVIRHCFRNTASWDGFDACFAFLKERGLKELGIQPRDPGYYVEWIDDFLGQLFQSDAQDFLAYLSFSGYRSLEKESATKARTQRDCKRLRRKLKESEKRRKVVEAELGRIKGSSSYKLGRALSYPLRALRK